LEDDWEATPRLVTVLGLMSVPGRVGVLTGEPVEKLGVRRGLGDDVHRMHQPRRAELDVDVAGARVVVEDLPDALTTAQRAQQPGNRIVIPDNDRLPLVVLERHPRISGDVIALVSFEIGVEHPREELRELRLTRATLADGTSRRTDVV